MYLDHVTGRVMIFDKIYEIYDIRNEYWKNYYRKLEGFLIDSCGTRSDWFS